MAKLPLNPTHPERVCWGCDRYCAADDLRCGNGTIRTQHPVEIFGRDWLEHGLDAGVAPPDSTSPPISRRDRGADTRDRHMAVKDSNGNDLTSGDTVVVIKDLRVKGSSDTLKRGTAFKNIRLIADDEEAVECGSGRNTVVLKTCFLKKS